VRNADMFLMCDMLSVTGCRVQTTTSAIRHIDATVKLNGEFVRRVSNWGVTILLINLIDCEKQDTRTFNTHNPHTAPGPATALINYLQGLKIGDALVAVSMYDMMRSLGDAKNALKQWGVDLSHVEYKGTVTFVAQKGFPDRTRLVTVPTEEASVIAPASLDVTVSGMHIVAI